MKKQFEETKFGSICSHIIDVVWLGILWLMCSLLVITPGAASCALYYTIVKSVRHGRGRATNEFFQCFFANIRECIAPWLVYLVICVPLFFVRSLIVYYIIPVTFTFPWVFSYISRFSCSFSQLWKNVLFLILKNPGKTLICSAVIVFGSVAAYLLPVTIPLLPGIICIFISMQTEPVFKELTQANGNDSNEDKWYNE